MEWDVIIGLETHIELSTRTKAFCSCQNAFGAPPNSLCCPVCLGLPGALPRLNREMVDYALRAALALACEIEPVTRFDRKNYFYPDLPKGYQISQLYHPLGRNGSLPIETEAGEKIIRIRELHMEEDAGKLLHRQGHTLIDYNRCGVPLLEIVTEPDFRSAREVIAYLDRLRLTMRYLGISDCKMQEGSLRCDVNLSLRPKGSSRPGTRTEMKNLGSFRAIARAIDYEADRQRRALASGGTVALETRRWDEEKEISLSMRPKETTGDYRYFPEPDLPPLRLEEGELGRLRASLPELPHEKQARYQRDWGLPGQDARLLTEDRALADYFEALVAQGVSPREGANWVMGDLTRLMKEERVSPGALKLSPARLAGLIGMTAQGRLNRAMASEVLAAIFFTDEDPRAYAARHGLEQIRDSGLVEETVRRVLEEHPGQLAQYRAGKEKLYGFFVGQTMRALKGKGDPKQVNDTLSRLLKS